MKRRNRKKTNQDIDNSWLLPYADLLTLLLALFIVLFSMSEMDVKKFEELSHIFKSEFTSGGEVMLDGESIIPEPLPSDDGDEDKDKEDEENEYEEEAYLELRQLQEMQKEIEAYIKANNLTDVLDTKLSGEGLFVTVRTDITFDPGSARVKRNGVEIAKEIAKLINSEPPHNIVVNGHADDTPMHNAEFASNWELSTMRAIQFMYLLIEDADLEPKWFSAKGYGEYRPTVENTTKENRAKNRRVEVLIKPNYNLEETLLEEEEKKAKEEKNDDKEKDEVEDEE